MRVLIVAVVLAAMFGAIRVAPAAAQTTALCPASIAPVKGGLGDRTSLGLDDGARGTSAQYEPGELIVILQPGRSAADLRCVAHELRAIIIEGGAGKRGLGGIPNAVVLQLQPRVSVQRTAALLLQPRYARLILTATPNSIATLEREDGGKDPTANDPLFPVQWGLSNVGIVPKDDQKVFPETGYDGMLVPNAFSGKRRWGIRVRQAWGLLSRQTVAPPTRVKIAILDDSLVQHPDLEANVADTGSARYTGATAGTRVELLKKAGTTEIFARDSWGEKVKLCSLDWDMSDPTRRPDATLIARWFSAQTNANCDPATPPSTWQITLDHARTGNLAFTYAGTATAPIDVGELWPKSRKPPETPAEATARRSRVATAIEQALLAILPNVQQNATTVAVQIRRSTNDTNETGRQELRIVLYGHDGQLSVDTTGLINQAGRRADVTSATADQAFGTVGFDNEATGGTFRIQYSVTIANLPNQQAPVTYTVTSTPIAEGAGYSEVVYALMQGVPDEAKQQITGFSAAYVPGFPRSFAITVDRKVANVADITQESFRVIDFASVSPIAPTSETKAYRPTGLSTKGAGEVTLLNLRGLPSRMVFAPTSADVAIAIEASDNAVAPASGKWPGQWKAGDGHGQFIAGVIGATTGNSLGMAGVIGNQTVTKSNIRLYGLISDLSKNGLIEMLEYGSSTLKSDVLNYSIGTSDIAVDLFDGAVGKSNRNRILRTEDPMPPDPVSVLMGSVGEASRTLFVVAAGNDGADIRRPAASSRVVIARVKKNLPGKLKVKFPDATQQEIDDAVDAAVTKAERITLSPCRPKGMGIRQRPLGIGARTSTKGGALSMLQMPDGTYDRGNILCVANADWDGNLAASSNWGPGIVDVAAPGQNLVGTSPIGGYSTGSGTSFAAPIVSGVAGMIYSILPNAQPWLVKCAILSSATSRPLRPANPYAEPYTDLTETYSELGISSERIPYPNGSPLTVNGMVQASEAISAALFLDGRVRIAQNGSGSWPTCVQKRGFFGGWKNTPVLG